MKKVTAFGLICSLTIATMSPALGEMSEKDRIELLEQKIELLMQELEQIKSKLSSVPSEEQKADGSLSERSTTEDVELGQDVSKSFLDRFSLGGYGEIHSNFVDGGSGDQFDIHRTVAYIGYEFADWIKLNSEIELEHAFVSSESDGELSIEQLYVDFLLHKAANIRAGRALAPLGIVNLRHEPTSFNGVERPSFARFIIPTTWSIDGVGLFGDITDYFKYQAYAVAGLDGSEFDSINGIRNGRIKERPSLHNPGFTARLDAYPLLKADLPFGQDLRLGTAIYYSGIDNGNKGDDPGIDGDITIYSGDFGVSIGRFDFRGEVAFTQIDGAENLNGVAEEIFGYYIEGAYHFWPGAWRKGLLRRSDALVFARFDDYDTQFKMPAGVEADPAGDRYDLTFGLGFFPVPNLVFKADYQLRYSESEDDPNNVFNLGLGWQF